MDQPSSHRRLSEISHLFLSDVREKQTGGLPRPQRTPPGAFRGDVSIDLTPEEFAQSFGAAEQTPAYKPVTAVLAHHLGERMPEHVRDYAASLCRGQHRVGIVYANAENIRIACIDAVSDNNADNTADNDSMEPIESEPFDADRARETLVELNQDVSRWLIVLPDPRDEQARALLQAVNQWTLLTGVDHESIVSGYRALKGLADGGRPKLTLAIFGGESDDDVQKARHKLAGVCEQFLQLNIADAVAIPSPAAATEHGLLEAMVGPDAGETPWDVLGELVAHTEPEAPQPAATPAAIHPEPASPMKIETPVRVSLPPRQEPAASPTVAESEYEQIIDLPDANAAPAAIIQAVVKGGSDLIESPIKAPAHPEAMVAVSRNHQLVLLAVAKQGLHDLRSIATAYRWMNENRSLIAMAVPQFSIDAHAMPQLRLLVDHADTTADVLQPLLATGNVTVQAYRKLRWGAKTGLLLEAA